MESKVSELLEKINRMVNAPSTAFSKIQYDLLMQHVRDLYEQLDELRSSSSFVAKPVTLKVERHEPETIQPEEMIVSRVKPEEENILLNDVSEVEEQVIATVVEQERTEPLTHRKDVLNSMSKVSLNEKIKSSESLNEKVKTVPAEIHHKLSTKPLKDLVDLNKRFVLVNELFKGNAEAFNKAIRHLDEQADLTTAENYIKTELAAQYEWEEGLPATQLFVSLVKQKFGTH